MIKHINFEDNLFILTGMVRVIRDSLILDTASELFMPQTIDNLGFIDQTLATLLTRLTNNTYLINRNEQFDNFSVIEAEYSQVLLQFMTGSGNISATQFPAFKEKITTLQTNSQERKKIIDDSYSATSEEESETLISSDEYDALLKKKG
jgi:hypothetical protein